MRYSASTPRSLVLGVGWGALWGTYTLGVHSLAALRATTVAGYLHVAMAIVGAVALLTGAKVLEGSLTARAVLLVSFVVFAVAEVPGVLVGAPVAVALVLVHLVAAVCVLRTSPQVYEATTTRSGVGLD